MTRHKRGKYALAIEDFERACADDPDNLALRKLLKQACDKFEEVRFAASLCIFGCVEYLCGSCAADASLGRRESRRWRTPLTCPSVDTARVTSHGDGA